MQSQPCIALLRGRHTYASSELLKSKQPTRKSEESRLEGGQRRRTLVTPRKDAGGADRIRTDDPLLAKQMLSQLSYSPVARIFRSSSTGAECSMVGLVGVEPTTPALSRRCSNQLSYRPVLSVVRCQSG